MTKFSAKVGLAIFVIFSVIGALASQTDLKVFKERCKKPRGLIVGVFCQYFILPLLGYLTAIIFDFDDIFAAALVIVCTCPGGTLSNMFTFMFGADLALSLAMTTTTSILSFAFILWNGWLYVDIALNPKGDSSDSSDDSDKDTRVKLDHVGLAISVGVLILALICGLTVSYKDWGYVKRIYSVCAGISILVMVVVAFMDNFEADENIGELGWRYWIGVIVLNICAWFSGIVIALMAGLTKPSALAMAIEISNQNTSLAGTIIWLSFSKDDAQKGVGIPLMYTFCCWAVVLMLGPFFQFLLDGWTLEENEEGPTDKTKGSFGARFKAAIAKAAAKDTAVADSEGEKSSKMSDDKDKVSTHSHITEVGVVEQGHVNVGGKVSVQEDEGDIPNDEDVEIAVRDDGNDPKRGSSVQLLRKKSERPPWHVTNDDDSSSSSEIDID